MGSTIVLILNPPEVYDVTAPYTPQQNDVAKRKNRVLTKMINAMLSNSGLGPEFWGQALLMACYILNRFPNKRSKTTPYEFRNIKEPNFRHLRVWGCRVIARVPEPKTKKLGERGIECIKKLGARGIECIFIRYA